jgi:hypothetical protein
MRITSWQDRLRFVVDFVNRKLDKVSASILAELRNDLERFVGLKVGEELGTLADQGIPCWPVLHPLPQEFSREDFLRLQGRWRSIIDGINASTRQAWSARHKKQRLFQKIDGGQSVWLFPDAGYFSLSNVTCSMGLGWPIFTGPTLELASLQLVFLLAGEVPSRILRCPEERCGHRIFYRIRSQQYCSRACVDRANKRCWRASKINRALEARRRQTLRREAAMRQKRKRVRRSKRSLVRRPKGQSDRKFDSPANIC